MLFLLKKFVSFFLMPYTISLILISLALFFLYINRYKRAKIFLSFGLLWSILIAYAPFSNSIIKPLEDNYPSYLDVDPNIKYVLVLGNAHITNTQRSSISQLSDIANKRLSEGVRIYKRLNNAKLIVSGYEGDDKLTAHAIILKNAAISLGVDKNDIIMQEKAKDTYEEAVFAKKIVSNEKLILVTSAFHMPRAMQIFKSFNINAIAAPTNYYSKTNNDYLTPPRSKELDKTTLAMHEYIGLLWFNLKKQIKFYLN